MHKSLPTLPAGASAAERYFSERYPGYRLKDYRTDPLTHTVSCFVLEPLDAAYRCPKCGTVASRFHDDRVLLARDFDITAGGPVQIELPSRRIRCPCCGCRRTEPRPDWLLDGHLITERLAGLVQKLLRLRICVQDVAKITGVDWNLIKELDKTALEHAHSAPDLAHVRRLAIDEISIHKGHKYATVIMDPEDRKILQVVEGKSQKVMRPFFESLKAGGFDKHIRAVSVDMNAAYPRLIKEFLPHAKLTYDRFHVMQMLNKNVLYEARPTSIQRAREKYRSLSAAQRKSDEAIAEKIISIRAVKNAEWLIITDPSLLGPQRQERLRLLRETNQLFADLYLFVAKLREVWTAASEHLARTLLAEVVDLGKAIAEAHEFKPIDRFVKMLTRRADGIVTACIVGLGTNILEGANNTAKVIKRVAYGDRDFEYFALKLKGAFPGRRFLRQMQTQGWTLVWQGLRKPLGFHHYS